MAEVDETPETEESAAADAAAEAEEAEAEARDDPTETALLEHDAAEAAATHHAVRAPNATETAEWVGAASKRDLIAFLQACGDDEALKAAKLPLSREQVSKNKLKKMKVGALKAAARALL